jgi:methyl-accepting chemotaxis protein
MKKEQDTVASAITLEAAYSLHQQWKENLRRAVQTKESIDTSTIGRDDCCDLGKWLYADGQHLYWGRPEFQSLLLHHKEFHLLAGAVAEVINNQQYELAAAYLSQDTQLAQSSEEVATAIRRLEEVMRV